MIRIPERVRRLVPYKPGRTIADLARERNLPRIVKLASNENPLGPSPRAMEAIVKHLGESHRYVDPRSTDLVELIAARYGKRIGQIICGHGTDSLLAYIINAFTEEGEEILTSGGSFIGMYVNCNKLGRRLSLVDLKDFAFDLDGIMGAVSKATRIIYLANPNNPTGTIFLKREFEEFMKNVSDEILVILDEAYTVYAASHPSYPDGLAYEYDNLIVTRTLSKSYGLGGLRIGFAVGPEYLISELYKVKLPFEPNFLAQKAALAALDDDNFLARTIETNKRSLEMMIAKFAELGIEQVESAANFVLLLLPTEEFAETFYKECMDRGLIVRHVKPFGIPRGIRINSGTEDETAFALEIIEDVYGMLVSRHRQAISQH